MASAIGRDERVDYLVSTNTEATFCIESIERLKAWGRVEDFAVTTPTGDSNTVRALLRLWRMRWGGRKYQRIFFFDESLVALAWLWPLFSMLLRVERLGVLHLFGPTLGKRN